MHIYMESRKVILVFLFAGHQWRCRHREQTWGRGGEGGEDGMNGERSMETDTLICEIDSQ